MLNIRNIQHILDVKEGYFYKAVIIMKSKDTVLLFVHITEQLFKTAITLAEMCLDPTIDWVSLSPIIYTVILLIAEH